MTRTILLVEDDPDLTEMIREYLGMHGFEVVACADGLSASDRVAEVRPDAVLLDVGLPGLDGFGVCRQLRTHYDGPVLFLTARSEAIDEVVGLEVGADDYIRKPLEPRVLLARLRSHLRRSAATASPQQPLQMGAVVVDPGRRDMLVDGAPVALTTAEFDLLWELARRAGQTVTRDELYQNLRGITWDGVDRSMDVRVARLRRKLGEHGDLLRSVRGVGYLFARPR
jgi:DNA-binding response OmpR family regulator